MNGRLPIFKMNSETKGVIRKLDTYNIDYVIINTRFYFLSVFAGKFAHKRKIPCLLIEHGTGHIMFNNKLVSACGEIYEHVLTWRIKKYVNKYYGVSRACGEWLEHFKINADGVLYNAIDLEQMQNLSKQEADKIKKIVEYSSNDKIITYTGRLIKEKGVLKLIDAIQEIRKKHPEIKLCIAGDGELYSELKGKTWENIYLLGKLDFTEVVQLLNITMVYCLPTDYPEGLPTSVLEAIACRNYIVTTTSGGAKEVIKNNDSGIVLAENTVPNLIKSIEEVIDNEDLRNDRIEKAYKKLKEEFTWENTVSKLVDIIES